MDQQEEVGLPLDVNAAAGILREIFALDVTAAEVTCGNCGIVAMVGETKLYGGVMGAIFRCAHCDGIVMRLVRTPVTRALSQRCGGAFVRPGDLRAPTANTRPAGSSVSRARVSVGRQRHVNDRDR